MREKMETLASVSEEQKAALDSKIAELETAITQQRAEAAAAADGGTPGSPTAAAGKAAGTASSTAGRGAWWALARPGANTIDNRTTTIAVAELPGQCSEPELRRHFAAFGEISQLAVRESSDEPPARTALVKFAQRFAAEAALARGTSFDGTVLALSWSAAALEPAAAARSADDTTSEPRVANDSSQPGAADDDEPEGLYAE